MRRAPPRRPRAPRAPARTPPTSDGPRVRTRTRPLPGRRTGGMAPRRPAPGGTVVPAPARAAPREPRAFRPSFEDGPREVVGVERPQVLERLAGADQLDRHPQLLRDGERDAALRRAVEL